MIKNFFGIEIERKTNILSFVAFVLSVLALLHQIYGFFQGPDVKLFPPDQILIFSKKLGKDYYLMFAAPMAYVNKGQIGYNAVVKRELISFVIGGKTYEHHWQEFITSSCDENNKLKIDKKEEAQPLLINAGNTISHETLFLPHTIKSRNGNESNKWKNYLKWKDFYNALAGMKELKIEFISDVYDKKPLKISRIIYIDDNLLSLLKKYGWAAPSCWESGK
jgi:hypothetical protein